MECWLTNVHLRFQPTFVLSFALLSSTPLHHHHRFALFPHPFIPFLSFALFLRVFVCYRVFFLDFKLSFPFNFPPADFACTCTPPPACSTTPSHPSQSTKKLTCLRSSSSHQTSSPPPPPSVYRHPSNGNGLHSATCLPSVAPRPPRMGCIERSGDSLQS